MEGFTSASEAADPEVVADTMNLCFTRLGEDIARYGGTVDKVIGDAVMALFGAPVAHDDDPRRAIEAALAMQRTMEELQPIIAERLGVPLAMRVGINTGLVVAGGAGPEGQQNYTVMGDAVNVAARLESAARPGGVLVSDSTQRLASGYFNWRRLEPLTVKGRTGPVVAYEVVGATAGPGARAGGVELFSRFVGRDEELSRLKTIWAAAVEGKFQIVDIVGEAGSGKSRLGQEFLLGLQQADEPHQIAYGSCPSVGSEAYDPFLQIIRPYLEQENENETGPESVEPTTALLTDEQDSSIRLRLELLVSPREAGDAGPDLAKEDLFSAVTAFFVRLSGSQPLALILEDLHWADTATVDLLGHLVRRLQGQRVLVITLRRLQGVQLPRQVARQSTQIRVDPLGAGDSRELVESVLGSGGAAAQVAELVMEKAQGNPFFLEEMIRSLIEVGTLVEEAGSWSCTRDVADIEVPDTVEGVLLARIDQLEERSRRLLQEASVVGRTFQDRVLGEITEVEERIGGLLRRLEDGDLIRYHRTPEEEYGHEFKHVLTREVAYNSLLFRRRSALHQRIASAIERVYSNRLQSFAEALAYHYEQAGNNELAAQYHLMASEKAEEVHAQGEARRHRQLAGRLMGLTSVWSMYASGPRPSWRLRLTAITTQTLLAIALMAPVLIFLATQKPPESQQTLFLPLEIFEFNAQAMLLPIILGAAPLLVTAMVFIHWLTPTYLQARPTWSRQAVHIALGWVLATAVLAAALALVVLGVRLNLLGDVMETYAVSTTLTILRRDLGTTVGVMVGGTLILSVVWDRVAPLERQRLEEAPVRIPRVRDFGAQQHNTRQFGKAPRPDLTCGRSP